MVVLELWKNQPKDEAKTNEAENHNENHQEMGEFHLNCTWSIWYLSTS